jgi:hypothetical protein
MDKGRDKQARGSGESRKPGDPAATRASKAPGPVSPGDVAADNRSRNVWHFHGETIDSTSMMLQKLDNPSLELEPTRKTKQIDTRDVATGGKAPAGKIPPGKAPQAGAGKSPGGSDGASARKTDFGGTTQSFEQRYEVKPGGRNRGGGFDPYNRS